jgi:uncharacterized protein YbjQ (UPF0145 family)
VTVQKEIFSRKGKSMPIQRTLNTILSLMLLFMLSGCAYLTPAPVGDLPPILAQEEVVRPYITLGRIKITRDVYGSDYTLTSDIRDWAHTAVRREAAKMGADAVILPEITGNTNTNAIIPSTEYTAVGVAIKFK